MARLRHELEVNVAERTAELHAANDEVSALRRVATLVAQGVPSAEIFAAVSDEVSRLFGSDISTVVRFERDGTATVLGVHGGPHASGARVELEPGYVVSSVRSAARAVRFDTDDPEAAGMPEVVRALGIRSGLASPIVVDGELWGAITLAALGRPLPRGIERRLAAFTELVATALANAQARAAGSLLAEEQAALRRVATLVARGAPAEELFAAVVAEVAGLLPVSSAAMGRFESDGAVSTVAAWSAGEVAFPVGRRWQPEGNNVTAIVARTGRPARLNDFSDASGPIGVHSRAAGYRSAVGSPIVVLGRLWGVVTAASTAEDPLPRETEARLASFTELVATAIANADSQSGITRLADEQAALRQVAVLVAQQPSPDEVFTAVTEAVGRLLGADLAAMHVYPGDGTAATIAGWSAAGPMLPIGTQLPLDGDSVAARIFHTCAAARMDSYSDVDGETAEIARGLRLRSTVGAPIVVDGALWGALMAATRGSEPLREDAETRIAAFTELVATAVSNAEARENLHRLADEQAALRRVATLVAEDAPASDLFRAVTREVGALLGADLSGMASFECDAAVTTATWAAEGEDPPIPDRWQMQPCDPATAIAEARRPVRWDDWTQVPGPAAAFIRDELGVRSTVGAPIVVEGRLWGVLAVHSKQDVPLPPDTEWRLQQFTELVATAIGNAEARAEAARLANEQAALRRVATLVAREVSPAEVFAKVAEEAAEALGDVECCLLRDQRDGTATVVAARGPAISAAFPVGTRLPVDGIGSAVGYPIVVRGEIWGALVVTASGEPSYAPKTERRIAQFADLVATAVGNAQARAELERLADEQAALRRVATLVAHGERPGEIFSAVSDEVARLFETDLAAVVRFEHDREATVVGTSKMPADLIPIGTRWPLDDALASAEVQRTGCSARMNGTYWRSLDTPVAKRLADLDIVSSVASPVVVDGAIWGAVIVASGDELPTDSEERLQRFGDLVATAIANAESKSELAASRRRIVAASDEARRRIERDLHDGTQQRLVSLGLAVRAAEANVPPDRDDLRSELRGIATGLGAAVEELQELSRGIHPAILSQGGLGPALRTLARRSAVPVELDLATDTRVSPAIEVAAYYVVSEGLANAAKHAQASRIEVSLARRDRVLLLSIRDDGVGGADPLGGSGLVGMTDRLEALGGSIRVKSPPGEGTSISAELPF